MHPVGNDRSGAFFLRRYLALKRAAYVPFLAQLRHVLPIRSLLVQERALASPLIA
jgi:hypothetical protein